MKRPCSTVVRLERLASASGGRRHGHSDAEAARVFDLMAYFAGDGFNKSHSAAYALAASTEACGEAVGLRLGRHTCEGAVGHKALRA